MDSDLQELDFRATPLGELTLRRRRDPVLDALVYEVKLGDEFLMSSAFHDAEVALATLGLAACLPGPLDVVVGGLGLGYTAAAALDEPRLRELIVVDALDAVIDWHRRGLVPLGPRLTGDARCRFVHADFFAVAAAGGAGFDAAEPARRFHAVLLDVDHSPRALLHPRHAEFYSEAGLRALAARLHPGGVFGLWSNEPPDAPFIELLLRVFESAHAEVVRFPNPYQRRESTNTVYVAVK